MLARAPSHHCLLIESRLKRGSGYVNAAAYAAAFTMIHAPRTFTAFATPDRALRRARAAHAVKVKIAVAIAIIKNEQARAVGSTAVRALRVGATPRDRAHAIAKMEVMPDKRFRRKYRMTRASFAKLLERIWPVLDAQRAGGAFAVNEVVPKRLLLAVTLRMLAGGLVLDVADDHEMGR